MVNALTERHGEKMNYNDCLYLETAITKYEKHVTLKMQKKKFLGYRSFMGRMKKWDTVQINFLICYLSEPLTNIG